MNTFFEDLKEGLTEAIDHERGGSSAKTITYIIEPVKDFSNKKIRKIRMDAGMTQAVMAEFMGVSIKTIEAWERGTTHPTGPAKRLLDIVDSKELNSINFINPKVK